MDKTIADEMSRWAKMDEINKFEYARALSVRLGKKRGRTEAIEEIVRNFKHAGAPFDLIAKATGLSLDKIKAL
ncbi:MAG: hypothetical protein LBQ52_05240 [Helicobacteraceae bacterium]|nr:hypothetical protein [Helicobacteraceae bacterium]